jgi:endogenous inhibitor of DNA gyrase (YacG/DUF329 family)
MRCPICKKTTAGALNPFRPFCSERCKLIDLDNWLEGRYKVPERFDAEENTGNFKDGSSDTDDHARK